MTIKDAYNYYIAHQSDSCNKIQLSFENFSKTFPIFMEQCAPTLTFNMETKEFLDLTKIPLLTNCGKSVILHEAAITSKIIQWKEQQS